MNNINIDKIKKNIIPIILIFLGIVLTTSKTIVFGKKITLLVNIIVITIELIVFHIIKKNKTIELHKLYLVIAIILGAFYIFAFPASEIPDELSDYLRASEISEFHLVTPQRGKEAGNDYSKNILKVNSVNTYKEELKYRNLKLTGEKTFIGYANKALYNCICYIPQTIGIGIGKILNISILYQIILGKILNYIAFIILMYFSIKYIPYKKSLVFLIALLPLSMQEAASLSPDALAISLSTFLVSYILKIRVEKKQITNTQIVVLLIMSVLLSLCKIVYLPLCFLVLLIPKELYKSKKHYCVYNMLIIGIATILNLVWLKYTSRYLIAFSQSNSAEQLKYILKNPILYIIVILNTLNTYLPNWILEISGKELGIFKVTTSILVAIPAIYILVKLVVGKRDNKKYEFSNQERIFSTLIVLGIIGLTFTSLYLQWTPLKSEMIIGIQGRYFIPLIIPLSYIFMKKIKENKINKYLIMFIIFINVIALLSIIATFI